MMVRTILYKEYHSYFDLSLQFGSVLDHAGAFLLFWCVSTTYDGRQDFLIFLKPDKLFYRIEFHTIQYPRNMLYMNLWYCKVWNSILTICWLLQFVILIYYKKLQWPGIEPGPTAWEVSVLSTLLWGLDEMWQLKFLLIPFSVLL